MYSRRLAIAAATGRKKTTFNTAKNIAKLISWTTSVPSIERNDTRLLHQARDDRRHLSDDEEDVERERDGDERHGLQHAYSQEHKEEDIRPSFRLPRDRFDCLRGDDTVADRRAEGDPRDHDAETEHRRGRDYRFWIHVGSFLVFVGKRQ